MVGASYSLNLLIIDEKISVFWQKAVLNYSKFCSADYLREDLTRREMLVLFFNLRIEIVA